MLNKCEEDAVLEDYRAELARADWPDARVFAVARDDAGYEPPAGSGLADLQASLAGLASQQSQEVTGALKKRCADVVSCLRDHVLARLQSDQQDAQRTFEALRVLRGGGDIDVSELTRQLQGRMRKQSVLYLMGPARVLERMRSVPGMVARLPRTALDLVRGRRRTDATLDPPLGRDAPDFRVVAREQFAILQSRIDDLLRTGPLAGWLSEDAAYAQTRLEPGLACAIVDEEIAGLRRWLEQHWNERPRDTRVLQKWLKPLGAGERVAAWSEAVPYLLITSLLVWHPAGWVVSGAAALGLPVAADLLGEMSDEVKARTRQANRRIAERFDALAAEQVERVCEWIRQQMPPRKEIERIERLSDELENALGARR